jgi:hypothetical protein
MNEAILEIWVWGWAIASHHSFIPKTTFFSIPTNVGWVGF